MLSLSVLAFQINGLYYRQGWLRDGLEIAVKDDDGRNKTFCREKLCLSVFFFFSFLSVSTSGGFKNPHQPLCHIQNDTQPLRGETLFVSLGRRRSDAVAPSFFPHRNARDFDCMNGHASD